MERGVDRGEEMSEGGKEGEEKMEGFRKRHVGNTTSPHKEVLIGSTM